MSFTRFHDDKHRVKKQVEESIYAGDYFINAPGPGIDLPYLEDPQIRLQKWGGNLRTNTISLENDLRGLTRKLNRDEVHNEYSKKAPVSSSVNYSNVDPFVEESRVSHPAWMYKDLEQKRWEHPLINPQKQYNFDLPFKNNLHSRILEKDYHVPKIPLVEHTNNYYLTGETICIGGKEESCPGTLYQNKIV